MNRGFGFYFGNAIKSSAKTLWRKGNLIKYFAWVIMELLSPFTLILGAMFSLANVRQAKIAERDNVIDIPQSFKVACRAKPFGTMILAIVLEALIFLAGVLLICVAAALLGAIGYVISMFVDTVAPQIIILIFMAPAALVLLVYFIIMPLIFTPTSYIIETNPDIGAADAISICFNTMKSRGKGTYFLNLFIPALVEGAILGLGMALQLVVLLVTGCPFAEVEGFGAMMELAILWFSPENSLAVVLAILAAIITFVAFALIAPMFALARKISNKSLFEDIVLDPVNASKRTSGVNIKRCKGAKFDPAEYENELTLLFDETASDRVPVPETPSARRKRELEERRSARAASAVYAEPIAEEAPPAPATPAPEPVPAAEPAPEPLPEPATAEADEEDDGALITVSDLIGDIGVEEPATAEEPVAEEATAEEPEPIAEPAEEPAQEEAKEEKAEEPAENTTTTDEEN